MSRQWLLRLFCSEQSGLNQVCLWRLLPFRHSRAGEKQGLKVRVFSAQRKALGKYKTALKAQVKITWACSPNNCIFLLVLFSKKFVVCKINSIFVDN